MISVHKGDTVRLKVTFYDWDGVLATPTGITIKIYNSSKTTLVSEVPINESVGVYYYDYTTTTEGKFSYEFSGTLDGDTILSRDYFYVIW